MAVTGPWPMMIPGISQCYYDIMGHNDTMPWAMV